MTQQLQGIESVGVSQTFVDMVHAIRRFTRDYPELNRLVEGTESGDRYIAQAIIDMLYDFAGTPPPLGFYTLESLVDEQYLATTCKIGAINFLLQGLILLMQRNALPFSDGGLSIDLSSKVGLLQQIQNQYEQRWEQAKSKTKISLNISGILGESSLGSEYSILAGWLSDGSTW